MERYAAAHRELHVGVSAHLGRCRCAPIVLLVALRGSPERFQRLEP